MTWCSTSAPGKAVLSGEYAVLDGAPAISMAVDCRARVTIEASGEDCHSVRSGVGDPLRFRSGRDGCIEWLDGGAHAEHALLEQVWRHLTRPAPDHMALTFDTTAFFASEHGPKLGLGSSAALAVALATALHEGEGAQAVVTAAAAHRAFQRGKGSGLDVATAVQGGLVGFRLDSPPSKLEWPGTLQYFFLWCGKPASTVEKLLQAEEAARSAASRRSAAVLGKASEDVFETWQQGCDAEILASFEAYIGALRQFSDDRRLGVFDAGHDELVRIAAGYGLVYKPCGAGGGDIGIALVPQAADPAGFTARAKGLGFTRLHCVLDARGLSVDGRGAS